MDFDKTLRQYAELIVCHGLNVQENQIVNISTEACHRDFAFIVAEAAYKRGASYVNIDLSEPRLSRTRIEVSKEEHLSYVPEYIGIKYRELVDKNAANLKIIGAEDPEILSDLSPQKVNTVRHNQRLAIKYFYDEGIGKSLIHWTVAAAATPGWAKKIFPELSTEESLQRLWQEIFKICRADKPNCLELWNEHDEALHRRAEMLNTLQISELHFTGKNTDLKVGLSYAARFRGGTDKSPLGVRFEPNLPTEEVYTTPDWRSTRGKVQTTRPFLINGKLVSGLYLEFDEGEISKFEAEEGEETFKEYISSDDGAKRLGEVALVGLDSPVYQSGIVFQEILFDENAACHIAVGSAYKFCLEGGESASKEELLMLGCNESTVHTDMMISDESVCVTAFCADGSEKILIKNGQWAI